MQYLNIEYNYYEEPESLVKECSTCKEVKNKEDFYLNKDTNRYNSTCKSCYRDKARLKYHKRANDLNDYKCKIGCNKCKDTRGYVLDFHHKDPSTKSFSISSNPNVSISNKKFIEEIEKCVLLCANCHREFHYLENKEGITIEDYLSE